MTSVAEDLLTLVDEHDANKQYALLMLGHRFRCVRTKLLTYNQDQRAKLERFFYGPLQQRVRKHLNFEYNTLEFLERTTDDLIIT
jgi:hypothetical protein